jgi:hypothetical protein
MHRFATSARALSIALLQHFLLPFALLTSLCPLPAGITLCEDRDAGKRTQQDGNAKAKSVLSTVDFAQLGTSATVKLVFRCKYTEKSNTIVPQRPALHFKNDVRIPANTIVQLS